MLFLARHHGLPVRLIDWTTSPLVALYFACVSDDNLHEDGAIWIFKNATDRNDDYKDIFTIEKPFSLDGIQIIFPFYSNPRMISQSSLFTIHAPPWLDISLVDNDQIKDNQITDGRKWLIPKTCKQPIIRELHVLQINERTLFPDLDGIAREILNTELVFRT